MTGRGGGRAPLPALCGLTHRFLTDRLVFSLFSLSSLPLKPSQERRRDVSGGHRGQRATESSLSGSRGRETVQARDPAGPGQAGRSPTPSAPAPRLRPVRRAPGSGPGPRPWRSAGAAARAGESPAFLTGSESSSSASRQSEPPLLRGPAHPRRPGSTRASSSGSGGPRGHPLVWPHHCGRPRPGGHTEALRPSLCAL